MVGLFEGVALAKSVESKTGKVKLGFVVSFDRPTAEQFYTDFSFVEAWLDLDKVTCTLFANARYLLKLDVSGDFVRLVDIVKKI